MKLLANENFPLKSILYLRGKNFDIVSIGQEIPGITDEIVIPLANEQDRIILTFDRDYGELIFKKNLLPKKELFICVCLISNLKNQEYL